MEKEEPKQEFDRSKYIAGIDPIVEETLEEGYERVYDSIDYTEFDFTSFKLGAKWQEERMYSEEEVKHIILEALQSALVKVDLEQWFKQFKKK